jgi:hypothetical protein
MVAVCDNKEVGALLIKTEALQIEIACTKLKNDIS